MASSNELIPRGAKLLRAEIFPDDGIVELEFSDGAIIAGDTEAWNSWMVVKVATRRTDGKGKSVLQGIRDALSFAREEIK